MARQELAPASDRFLKSQPSSGRAISTVPSALGTKRKASDMGNVESSQGTSQTCPPIKLEPSSPNRSDDRGSKMRDSHTETHGMSTGYVSSSSNDDTDDLMLDVNEDEGAINERGTRRLLVTLPMLDDSPPPGQQKASRPQKIPRRQTGRKLGDISYNSIPDYSPPISTLSSGNPHILQLEWCKDTFLDLSKDPDRHMLHEAEIKIASSLSISCAKYLCTKRRIFQARFNGLQSGKVFKLKDAHKVCRIDRTKVSQICCAFKKVGWFDEKYFLGYLDERSNPARKTSSENKRRGSSSSELTEPDIWDVIDSEFHFTSEGDEESTNDDSADSSVSHDDRHDETEGRKNLDSYRDNSLRKQHYGLSLIEGNGSQRRVLIERIIQNRAHLSTDEAADEGPTIKDRRPKRRLVPEERLNHGDPDDLSGSDTKESSVLETASMTPNIKLALDGGSGDDSDSLSNIKTKSSQQKPRLEKIHRPTNQFTARIPIPQSLDEANAVDIMLVEMKEKDCPWLEIQEAWEKKTGKARTKKSLSCRYDRIMANIASAPLEPDEERDSLRSLAYPRLDSDAISVNGSTLRLKPSSLKQNQLLFAAEAEIEENFQREKAAIIAEIEDNYQSEKWNLVAEAMSRNGLVHHSAEWIQAQYERLTTHLRRVDSKDKENHDISTDLPRRTTLPMKERKTRESTLSRSDVERLDETSIAVDLPQPQLAATIRKKYSRKESCECENCGRKYKSSGGLIYHHKQYPNCTTTKPRPYNRKENKLRTSSFPGGALPRAEHQRPLADPPAPRVSFPNLMISQKFSDSSQLDENDDRSALDDATLRLPADGADCGLQSLRKTKQTHAEHSARARKVWAKRRALGTNGRHGGPQKMKPIAKKAKPAPPGNQLASTVTDQSGHSPKHLANPTAPIAIKKEALSDANDSLEQTMPAAPQTDSGPRRVRPFEKVSTDETCHGLSLTRHSMLQCAIRTRSPIYNSLQPREGGCSS